MSLRGLIFDVDGTLADTEEAHRCAFNAAFAEAGLPWFWNQRLYKFLLKVTGGKERIEFYIRHIELPQAEREQRIQEVPALHESKTRFYAEAIQNGEVPLRSGILPIIQAAKAADLKLAIASTTTLKSIEVLIEKTLSEKASDVFDAIACGDEVAAKKPAPDIYLLALSRLSITAKECVAFEDSQAGVTAARHAGLCTVASPTQWSADDDVSAACKIVRDFDEVSSIAVIRALLEKSLLERTEAA